MDKIKKWLDGETSLLNILVGIVISVLIIYGFNCVRLHG